MKKERKSDIKAKFISIDVRKFYEATKEELKLEIVAGAKGLSKKITEPTIHRCGLGLTGFFKHFAFRRIQVIGLAEHTYLASLEPEVRYKRLKEFFKQDVPCVVVTRQKGIFKELKEIAEETSTPLLRTPLITKVFINAATIAMENLIAPRIHVNGTMVEVYGIGVLIEGEPGIGKSESALCLIKRGHSLISDDVTVLRLDSSGMLIGSAMEATRYHMEIKGLNIIHVPSLFGVWSVREEKRLDLIITLCDACSEEMEKQLLYAEEQPTKEILGVKVSRIFIPVAPGRNLADIIETAALNERLKRLGHDAIKELDQRLIDIISKHRSHVGTE